MKVETWSDNDDYPVNYVDYIQIWILGLYIDLCFYPVRFWTWEWGIQVIKRHIRPAIRFEFPSFSLYIAKKF